MKKTEKRGIAVLLMLAMVLSLAACGGQGGDKKTADPTAAPAEGQETTQAPKDETDNLASGEPVTIKIFSNLPDRTTGQGLLEQQLMDAYVKENSNVTFELETLQDEAYKTKFTAYTSSNNLPDLLSVWGQPAFIDPVINSGYLAELNPDDYKDDKFVAGSMDGFSKDGKLYGLPRNTDMQVIFYNKQIFADNGLSVPKTMDEFYNICDVLNAEGISPCSMAGQDKWPIACMYTDFVMKSTGDKTIIPTAVSTGDFSNPSLLKAAQEMKALIDKKLFQTSFLSADYGAARNLFAQGKAAMFYMGSWEMSMASDEAIDEAVRSQVGAFSMPVTNGSPADPADLAAWNGGGYSVSANSQVKEETIKFMNYMFKPENWAKGAWQNGICIPAQSFDMTGEETEVQKTLVDIFNNAHAISGTPINDSGTPTFKTESESACQEFAAGMLSPEGFIAKLQDNFK